MAERPADAGAADTDVHPGGNAERPVPRRRLRPDQPAGGNAAGGRLTMGDPHKHKSKFLSLVLRHEPERVGIRLDESGWVAVDELLEGCRRAGNRMTLDELKEIVRTNNKQRFAFSDDGTRIRANQGHSVEVELGYEPATPPEVLYHGTAEKHLPGIRREGLIKGARHHVHLSER